MPANNQKEFFLFLCLDLKQRKNSALICTVTFSNYNNNNKFTPDYVEHILAPRICLRVFHRLSITVHHPSRRPWWGPPLTPPEPGDGQGESQTQGNCSSKAPFTVKGKIIVPPEMDSEQLHYTPPLNILSKELHWQEFY